MVSNSLNGLRSINPSLTALLSAAARRLTKIRQVVADYNATIKKFPTVIYAGWFGFDAKPQFKAEAGASQAPKVEF